MKIPNIKFDKEQKKNGFNKFNHYQFGNQSCIGCKRDKDDKELWCEICKNYQQNGRQQLNHGLDCPQ